MADCEAGAEAPRGALLIACGLALAPAVSLGIARFAYALVLPDMRVDLGWSYVQAGWMTASNAAGYLVGALLTAGLVRRYDAFTVVMSGTLLCVLSLAVCAAGTGVVVLNSARAAAGLGGGVAFVSGGVLAASLAQREPDRASLLLGIYYAGPGLGILLSGLLVPAVVEAEAGAGWRCAWLSLTLLSLLLCGGLSLAREAGVSSRSSSASGHVLLRRMAVLMLAYGFFGAGYIAYMTFMIAWVETHGGGRTIGAMFWCIIGGGGMVAPWLWRDVLRQWRGARAFSALTAVTAAGAALPLLVAGASALLLSAALFGCAFFSVVASTTAFVRENFAPSAWGGAIAGLTVSFGLGQTVGPLLVGSSSEAGGLAAGLTLSVVLLIAASLLALLQRNFSPARASDDQQEGA